MNNLKIAIVHDYIKEQGGAEVVLEELLRLFPTATLYTSLYAPEFLGPHEKRYENFEVQTTWMNSIPMRHKLISPLRLLSPFAFKGLDLRFYDVVIVSQTGAYFPNLVRHKKGRLICYSHTPPRYLYGYKTARDLPKNPIIKVLSSIAFHILRIVDYEASKNVDYFVANSEEVRGRIEKFYRRDASVIYPPVRVPTVIKSSQKDKDYYLFGGRLARAKGVDVIIDAFIKSKRQLKIFGRGFAGYEDKLRVRVQGQKAKIEFLGEVSDERKFELMAGAKGFIFASYDEDFGITPVESMGVGTPVIAYRSGGVKETVVENKTGVFFDENSPAALNEVIEKFEKMTFKADDCIQQAEKFSEKEFGRKIREVVDRI